MGDKITQFGGDAERDKCAFDGPRKIRKIRRGFQAAPQNTRAAFIREKTESAELHLDGRTGVNGGERSLDGLEFFRAYLANELHRDMHGFGPHPFDARTFWLQARDQFAKRLADSIRKIECDEQPHRSSPAMRGE
jgi:hypothetical protein